MPIIKTPKRTSGPPMPGAIPLPGMTTRSRSAGTAATTEPTPSSSSSQSGLYLRKFDGMNFTVWKAQAEAYMTIKDCFSAVKTARPSNANEASAWDEKNDNARAIILLALDDNQAILVVHLRSAKEIWDRLEQAHHQTSQAGRVAVQRQFYAANMRENEPILAYIARVQTIYNQLLESGVDMQEDALVGRIVAGLTNNWHVFMTNWANNPDLNQTMAELLPRLKAEENLVHRSHKQRQPSETVALYTQKKDNRFKDKEKSKNKPKQQDAGPSDDKKTVKCTYCKKKNHTEDECRKKKKDEEGTGTIAIAEVMLSSVNHSSQRGWIIDSGSSDHMTNDYDSIANFKQFSTPKWIRMGDSGETKSIGYGDVRLKATTDNGIEIITLKEVLFVPNLRHKLISVAKVLDRGHTAQAHGNTITILNSQGCPIIQGIRSGNLFEAKVSDIYPDEVNSSEVQRDDDLEIWHERLAHVSRSTVVKMQKHSIVTGLENSKFKVDARSSDRRIIGCEACCLSKHSKAPIPLSTRERATIVGETIHLDICGPVGVDTIGGGRYIVVFKDEFSNYRFCFVVKSRESTYDCIRETCGKIHAETGNKVRKIVSDCGSEMTSNRSKAYFLEQGIVHLTSVPFCPQQNGFIERENRTLLEAVRAMLFHRKLPEPLWGEATGAAIYLLNRIPNKNTKLVTPFELYFGKKPRVNHLRVYGSIAFVKTQQKKRSGYQKKLEPRSMKLTLVGYDRDFSYRLYDHINNKIILSRDVIFDESKMPEISIPEVTYSNIDCFIESSSPADSLTDEEDDLEANVIDICDPDEPTTYEQAISSPDHKHWKLAMDSEYQSLIKNQTWSISPLPANKKVVQSKWVYKIKPGSSDQPPRYKARLVAKGFTQKQDIDYDITFSPVVRLDSIRLIFSLVAELDLELVHFDVRTAFLYGIIDKEIWMAQPKGYEIGGSEMACKLNRSIYGLKQASYVWNKTFTDFLLRYNLTPLKSDSCVFVNNDLNDVLILAIYVDDGLVAAQKPSTLTQLIKTLQTKFEMSVSTASCYVGLEIKRERQQRLLHISQSAFAQKTVERFGLAHSRPANIPMRPGNKFVKLGTAHGEPSELIDAPYRQAIGCLIYLMNGTRPDIACSVAILSRFCNEPRLAHWEAVKMVLRYVASTVNLGIKFDGKNNELVAFSDADHAGCLDTRRSTSGFSVIRCGAAIVWKSTKQSTTSESSTESEFIACSTASREVVWIRTFLSELIGSNFTKPTKLFVDNQSAIKLVKNNQTHSRIKHLDIKMFAVRERESSGHIDVTYVPTEHQTADILTKPLHGKQFSFLRGLLGVSLLLQCVVAISGLRLDFESILFKQPSARRLTLRINSPCPAVDHAFDEMIGPPELSSKHAIQHSWKTMTLDLCNEIYSQRVAHATENVANCHKKRDKRSILQVAQTAYSIIGFVIGITNLIRGNSQDSSTDVRELAQGLLTDLNQTTLVTLTDRSTMSHEGVQSIALISPSSAEHQFRIQEEVRHQPLITWATYKVISEMYAGAASLNAIADQCRNNRLATREISELLERPELSNIHPESTILMDVKVDHHKGDIEFTYVVEETMKVTFETLAAILFIIILCVVLGAVLRSQNRMAQALNRMGDRPSSEIPMNPIVSTPDDPAPPMRRHPLALTGV